MPIPFVTVDAFTTVKFRGNPAAVVILPVDEKDDDGGGGGGGGGGSGKDGFPTDAFLIDVAKEMNLSETAFVKPSSGHDGVASSDGAAAASDADAGRFEDFDLRWFTPDGTEAGSQPAVLSSHSSLKTHASNSTLPFQILFSSPPSDG